MANTGCGYRRASRDDAHARAHTSAHTNGQVGARTPISQVVFALSNPKTQAEITAENAYKWSNGKVHALAACPPPPPHAPLARCSPPTSPLTPLLSANLFVLRPSRLPARCRGAARAAPSPLVPQVIYGSGTAFAPITLNGKTFAPGQVNNFFIFPGMSFGAVMCDAKSIPEKLFMVSAEAVAKSLSAEEVATDRVVPHPDRIRDVSLNVRVPHEPHPSPCHGDGNPTSHGACPTYCRWPRQLSSRARRLA